MTDSSSTVADAKGASCDDESYESAVRALLSPGIHQATTKEDIARSARRRTRTVSDMRWYWNTILRANASSPPAARASPNQPTSHRPPPFLIHITGTKGKGSTACMCEAILRNHGYSTGLFTSPHLMDIRERIRWNGKPVHETLFASVYWKIRRALENADETMVGDDDPPPKLPGYFRMLTLMGLYTFLHELSGKVDAIILEVGMGGRYDATNFLDIDRFSRMAHGVTLLDLDHTRILGDTLEKIAWEKGGIFSVDKLNPRGTSRRPSEEHPKATVTKDSSKDTEAIVESGNAASSPQNFILDSNAEEVVAMMQSCSRWEGKDSALSLVDATGSQLRAELAQWGLSLGLAGNHQYGNATLAMALCQSVAPGIGVDFLATLDALASAQWPGRCQTLAGSTVKEGDLEKVRFYLDGAHTPQSLEATVDWLASKSSTTTNPEASPILVFNCSHERNPLELLELFLRGNHHETTRLVFSRVYFAKSDSSRPSPVARASAESLLEERGIVVKSELLVGAKATRTWQETLASVWKHLVALRGIRGSDEEESVCCNMTAREVLNDIRNQHDNGDGKTSTQVFVTGSLYLVGSFLTAVGWHEESSPPI